jgi:hypothetical protein
MATNRAQTGSRRQWVLLALLLVVLAVFVIANRGGDDDPATAGGARQASNAQGRQRPQEAGRAPADELDVKLEALEGARRSPAEIERNPFRMEARQSTAPNDRSVRPPSPPVEVVPPQPSGPAPIPLKFTGIIESETAGRIAALTDCKNVFQGREGDIIEGRYRIVRIGVESIVLEDVTTGSQQTIRLSGCG